MARRRRNPKKEIEKLIIKLKTSNESNHICLGDKLIARVRNEFLTPRDSIIYVEKIDGDCSKYSDYSFRKPIEAILTIPRTSVREILACPLLYYIPFFSKENDISLRLYLSRYDEDNLSPTDHKKLKKVLSIIFEEQVVDKEYKNHSLLREKENLEELYTAVKSSNEFRNNLQQQENKEVIHHPFLRPTLREYQNEAVQWMLYREKTSILPQGYLNPLYKLVQLPSGTELYYSSYYGHVKTEKPQLSQNTITGGILADEMGLGKTVEVLALILQNTRFHEQNTEDNVANSSVVVEAGISKKKTKKLLSNLLKNKDGESKKRKSLTDDDDTEEYIPKKSRKRSETEIVDNPTCDDVAKSKPKKSVCKEAAQNWYLRKLSQVAINPYEPRIIEYLNVQCICGETDVANNEIKCKFCEKNMHKVCVNYEGEADEFCCPQCWKQQTPIPIKATLIISPQSISRQWATEIKKHIKKNGLKVFIYRGVIHNGYIYPTKFSKYDIVLTTYQALQSEIKYEGNVEVSRNLRYIKKYNSVTSPLTSLEWWRICLDEAQLVQGTTTLMAQLAHNIPAIHKWAITGTPAEKSINDLYGLIFFLKIYPYDIKEIWHNSLYLSYKFGHREPLVEFLSRFLWRTMKSSVLDQINIPPQTEVLHWLNFNPVETYFYVREHEACMEMLYERLKDFCSWNITLKSIDRHLLTKILRPFLSIRQACIHANVVRGHYLTQKNKGTSVSDLLEALILKALNDCSDSLRAHVAASNGLAGIYIIQNEFERAAEMYREALRTIDEQSKTLSVDTLPQIHTLYNLSELLESDLPVTIPKTLRDSSLRDDALKLEDKFIGKHIQGSIQANQDYQAVAKVSHDALSKFQLQPGAWFPALVEEIGTLDLTHELMDRLSNVLNDYTTKSTMVEHLQSPWTLIYQITTWWDKVLDSRQKIRKEFEKLSAMLQNERFSRNKVSEAVACHLRPHKNQKVKNKCFMCAAEIQMLQYECLIFLMAQKKIKTKREILSETEKQTEGSWKSSEQEIVLKTTLGFSRQKCTTAEAIQDGDVHLELCEALKKEFRELRRLWTYYGDIVASQDEVDMCKQRLRLRLPDEAGPNQLIPLKNLSYNIENKMDTINVIDPLMVPFQLDMLRQEKDREAGELTRKLGTLAYLKMLRKRNTTGLKPDPCPICTNQLENNWCVLICGHSFCLDCLHNLLKRCIGKTLKCSVCRAEQHLEEISYVNLNENVDSNEELKIIGSFSTKIEGIVKHILTLRKEDPDVKILVFSTWEKVLDVINSALQLNSITSEFTKSADPKIVDKFKSPQNNVTALLLPLRCGSKGLNIIEATHVILVEPLTNPAEEMQALGRVHRIGQTKPTFVHRFLIKDTIEENIFNAVSSNSEDWNKDNVTLSRIYELFTKRSQTEDVALNENEGNSLSESELQFELESQSESESNNSSA